MAYQKKYFFDFYKLKTTEKHTVEIEQDTTNTLTPVEITGLEHPFDIEMPSIDHKGQVVRGKGCTINMLSKTDGQFFTGLYHVNPTEIRVKHYIGGVLDGLYYLDSEMMSEPYDVNKNYPVSVTGSDGFALMDRFSFVQSDGTNYVGIKSKFEILQIVLNKIGLPWQYVYIYLSTTFTGYSNTSTSTILHQSYIDCANFYDEDGLSMSLREVLTSILTPYWAHIYADKGNIYICDNNAKATLTTISYKGFNLSNGAYSHLSAIPNVKAITADKFMGTGQQKEMSGGVNMQVVSYSPYPQKTVIENSLSDYSEFSSVPDNWTERNGYNYKYLGTNKYWHIAEARTVVANPTVFESSYYTQEQDENIYVRMPRYGASFTPVISSKTNPFLVLNKSSVGVAEYNRRYMKGVSFKLSGEILCETKNNPYDPGQASGADVMTIVVLCRLKVGNWYYDQTYNRFTTENTVFQLWTTTQGNQSISDTFIPIGRNGEGMIIPVREMTEGESITGEFSFEIYDTFLANTQQNTMHAQNPEFIKGLWFKNISIGITDYNGNDIDDNDVEYIGMLDKNFKNEGETVSLTCGTDAQYSDRGKILKYNGTTYSDITEWTRAGQTFKIEELLLRSLSSNYRTGYITLSGMKLKADFSIQNILTDANLPGKKLMVQSARIDHWDNVIECDLVEILPDELTIVKE